MTQPNIIIDYELMHLENTIKKFIEGDTYSIYAIDNLVSILKETLPEKDLKILAKKLEDK